MHAGGRKEILLGTSSVPIWLWFFQSFRVHYGGKALKLARFIASKYMETLLNGSNFKIQILHPRFDSM